MESRKRWDMNQCLRCNQPCSTASVFCGNCLSLLQTQKRQREHTSFDASSIVTARLAPSASEPQKRQVHESQDTGEGIVTVTSPVLKAPETPSPFAHGSYGNIVEQAMNRL